MTDRLYIGWKDINAALRVSTNTAKGWIKKYGLPIKFMDRKPILSHSEMMAWYDKLPALPRRQKTTRRK